VKAEELEPVVKAEELEPVVKAEELEPVVRAEELEPVVKAEELEPVAKAEELEPVAKAEAVEPPLDTEDLETATAVEAVEPSVEGKEPDPAAAIDGLESLAKTEPVAILEDPVASVEELESAAKIADFEQVTKAEALEPLAEADTPELISAEPTTVQEVEPVSQLKEASDENFEPAAEVETFVPSENAEFINSAQATQAFQLPAELEQSSSNTSDFAFQQWAGGAPNVVLEPSSEAEPVYPHIDFTSQEDSAVEELPVDLSSPPISHEATAGNTLASTEFSTPAQYLDFTVDESETPQEEASASSLPLVEPVPDSPSIYAQIDFEPDEPATQSSEAMSLASLLAQRPAPDPDAELMYSWIGGESTDPFFVLHLCYFRAVRQVLQRQQIKESALGVHDYRRVLRNMGIAYNVLMDPGIRVDYDLRQLGLREPAWGHGLTIPEDAKLPEAGGKVRIAFHELLILCRIFDSEQMLAIVNASRLLSEDRFWSYLAESGLLSQVELDSIRSGYKLITNGLVSVNQFEQAFHFARAHQQQILEILLQAGWIRIEDLQQFANTPDEEELPEAPKFVETKVLPVQKGTAEFNVAASMPSWMDWGDSAELSDSSAGEGHSPFPHPADPGPSVGEDESQTSNLIDHLDYSKLADAANAQLNVTSSEYEPGDLASYQDAIQYVDQLEAPSIEQAMPEAVAPPVEAKEVANQDLEAEADPTNAVSKAVLSHDSELPASPVQQDYGMSDVWEAGHENAVENASSPEDSVEGIVESTEVDSVVNIQRKDSTTDPLAATNVVDDTVFSAIERPRRNEDELPERDDFASGLLVDQEEGDRSIDIADALAKTLKSNMAASLIGSGVSSSDDEINNNQDKPNNENTPSLVGQKVKMKELEFVIEPIEKSVHDLMNEIDKSIAEIESAAIQEQKADSDKSEDGDGD
ncbi:MAG: hypothetical protein K2X77_17740, partial [Candidatus Obscuribacterales bacterium]|nr:hypothetical protein [Candidatus Obscuribacterales bacterium]